MAQHRPHPDDDKQQSSPPCAAAPPAPAPSAPPPPAVPVLRAAPPPALPLSAGCGGGATRRSGNGLPGSRRHRRWERNNFVGNPHVVFPAKFDTSSFPGISYDVPRFHFSYEFICKLAAQCATPSAVVATPRKIARLQRRRARLAGFGRTTVAAGAPLGGEDLGRGLRRTLRRSAPKGFLLTYEVPLKKYVELLRRTEEEADEALQAAGQPGGGPPVPEPDLAEDKTARSSTPDSESSFEFCNASDTSEPVVVLAEDEEWESSDVLGMLESLYLDGVSNRAAAGLRPEGGADASRESVAPGPLCDIVDKLLPQEHSGPLKTLVLEIENPFCRYVFHTMCAYYSLHSYSCETAEGKRQTYVCWSGRGKKKLVVPQRSFYEWLFGSYN